MPDDFIYLTTRSDDAQVAVVLGTPRGELTDEALSRIAIEKLIDLLADAGLRKTLADIGAQADSLLTIAIAAYTDANLTKAA